MKVGQEFFPKRCEMRKINANRGRPLGTGGRHYKFAPKGIGWALNEEFSTPQQLFVTGTIWFVARHLICVVKRAHNIAFKLVLRQCCKTNCSLLWFFVARFTVHTPWKQSSFRPACIKAVPHKDNSGGNLTPPPAPYFFFQSQTWNITSELNKKGSILLSFTKLFVVCSVCN